MFKYYHKILIATAFFALVNGGAGAQQMTPEPGDYIASNVPDSLKKDANSVVRYSSTDMDVEGPGDIVIDTHQIITMLNDKGNQDLVLPYNRKYNSFHDIEIKVYDSTGKAIAKYHKGDMYDGAAVGDEAMVTDDRFLALRHTVISYPETIEIKYEEKLTSEIDLNSWDIQGNQQSIQFAAFQVSIDKNAGFRYLNRNISLKPKYAEDSKGRATYEWSVNNLKAIKLEEHALTWKVFPEIDFAAKNFVYYGKAGDLSSWKAYGEWQKNLNADGCSLSTEREAEIRKMTDAIKSPVDKAKFLYHYLQQNVRYVSIQLGIGGLKPFPASFVDEKKYGDCKALCNYMCALLKAVNIKAYYAKVRAGANEEPYDPAFPFDLSNHIIVCIPFKNDTTWLECTSQYQPFGQLGTFTENRNALLITEDGGKLVSTPKSTAAENQLNGYVDVKLDADGGAKASVRLATTGVYRDDYIGIATLKDDEQKEAVLQILNIKQPGAFDLTPDTDKNGIRDVGFNLTYDDFSDIKTGDKMFYRPHVFDLVAFTLPPDDHRKYDYYFESPMKKACTTIIELPAGYEVEALPASQDFKFAYGEYHVKYSYDSTKNQVTGIASFTITNQDIPAAQYGSLQQFLDNINSAQNKKLIIKRKA